LLTHLFDRDAGHDDLLGFGLRGHAVRRVYRGTEYIVLFLHHRAEVATDTNRYRDPVFIFFGVGADARLHLGGCSHRIIGGRERGHHLVADSLDDGAVELVGRVLHDLETMRNGLAGLGVAVFIV
jgi:hypothetical protein